MAKVAIQTPKAAPAEQKVSAQKIGKKLSWSKEAEGKIKRILKRYPEGKSRSATIPVLWLAQQEFEGWVSVEAMELVAETLGLPYIRVYEVATFYTMFNLKPVGKYHVQVCTNCACMIRGSDAIVSTVKEFTGISKDGGMSHDKNFTLTEVECLGACVDAPMMQVNNHYYTRLTAEKTAEILDGFVKGETPEPDTGRSDIDPLVYVPEVKKAKSTAKKGRK
jgi:NADH-quinone oxidoreductase E subunit